MLRDTFFTKADSDSSQVAIDIDDHGALELPIDLFRSDNNLIVRAPIAGANLHHITVSLGAQKLTITKAEHIDSSNANPDRIYLEECHWGELSRTIELPLPVNPDHTRATLNDGVLTVIMPIINPSQSKFIKIKE
jgi:HSP20 family protein